MTGLIEQFRAFKTSAFHQLTPFAHSFDVTLPNQDWEPFHHTEGASAKWREARCPIGQAVIFETQGEAVLASHFHKSSEIIVCLDGEVGIRAEGRNVVLIEGHSYRLEAKTLHSVHFVGPSSLFVWWPENKSKKLDINILKE